MCVNMMSPTASASSTLKWDGYAQQLLCFTDLDSNFLGFTLTNMEYSHVSLQCHVLVLLLSYP